MFAISLINRSGGSCTATGRTMVECRTNAAKISASFPGSFLVGTIPYATYRRGESKAYDVSIPFEIKRNLGLKLRLTYSENG